MSNRLLIEQLRHEKSVGGRWLALHIDRHGDEAGEALWAKISTAIRQKKPLMLARDEQETLAEATRPGYTKFNRREMMKQWLVGGMTLASGGLLLGTIANKQEMENPVNPPERQEEHATRFRVGLLTGVLGALASHKALDDAWGGYEKRLDNLFSAANSQKNIGHVLETLNAVAKLAVSQEAERTGVNNR